MMRIAWFSPRDVSASNASPSAYLTRTIVPRLRSSFDVQIVSDYDEESGNTSVIHFLRAFDIHREKPFDLWVYQLENSKATWFSRMHLAIQPGVVIFHDLLLSDYGPDPMLSTPSNEILDGFLSNEQHFPGPDTYWKPEGPYAFREASFAPVKIFMTRKDIAEWRRVMAARPALGSQAFFLPYPVVMHREQPSKVREGRPLRIGFAGNTGIEQRAHVLLESLRGSSIHFELVWLIDPSEKAAVQQMVNEFDVESCTIIEGRTPERWQEALKDIDVAVHLHFSVFGGVGPFLPVSVCAGVPVMASEFGDALTLPRDFFFFVQPGSSEIFEVRELLNRLVQLPAPQREELKSRLRAYGNEMYGADVVAKELGLVLRESSNYLTKFLPNWESFLKRADSAVIADQPGRNVAGDDWLKEPLNVAFSDLGWKVIPSENV